MQLALDDGDERLVNVAGFCAEVGLPRTLEMLGAPSAGEPEIQSLAANHPLTPRYDDLVEAIRKVERAGRGPAPTGS